jgi:hypothetical protein
VASTNPLDAIMERIREHSRKREKEKAIAEATEVLSKLAGFDVTDDNARPKPPKPLAARPRRSRRNSSLH